MRDKTPTTHLEQKYGVPHEHCRLQPENKTPAYVFSTFFAIMLTVTSMTVTDSESGGSFIINIIDYIYMPGN